MFRSHSTPLTWVYAVWNALQIFDRQISFEVSPTFHVWMVNCTLYIFGYYSHWDEKQQCMLRKGDFCCGRSLAIPLFWTACISDVVQVMLLLPVSQSESGGKGCFDRTCKSIPFSGKQRLIPQWPDGCWVVGSRLQIWVGWYQTNSQHLSLPVQRGMK